MEQDIRLGDVRSDGGLDADHGPALVLRRHELARQFQEDDEGPAEEDDGQEEDQAGAAKGPPEGFTVQILQPTERSVDGQAELAPALARRLQELGTPGRGQGDRLDVGKEDGQAQGDAELEKIAADDALHENDGDEDGHDGQGCRQRGEGDLLRPLERRRHEGLAALAVAEDVLHDHDGIVDDDADGQGQPEQGEGVEGEPEEIDDGHRAEEGHGDGQDDVESAREGAEEHPTNESGQHDGQEELELDLVDGLADELRAVVGDRDRHVLGQGLAVLIDGLVDRPGHGDGVRATLLADADALGRASVDAGDAADVLEAVLDQGHVAEVDGTARDLADDDLAQGLKIDGLAEDADIDLPAGSLEPAGRQLDVFALQGGDDVAHRQALLVESSGVEPDADVALERAHERDFPDPGNGLELLLETVADVVAQNALRVRAAQSGHQDGLVLGVLFGDDGRIHVPRQAASRLRDLGLDVLEGQVDVSRQLDLDGDAARSLA